MGLGQGQANTTNEVHGTIEEGYELAEVTASFSSQTQNSWGKSLASRAHLYYASLIHKC